MTTLLIKLAVAAETLVSLIAPLVCLIQDALTHHRGNAAALVHTSVLLFAVHQSNHEMSVLVAVFPSKNMFLASTI